MEQKPIKIFVLVTVLAFAFVHRADAQHKNNITGRVVDASGNPIKGARMTVAENKAIQTVSNNKGEFEINAKIGQHLEIDKSQNLAEKVLIDHPQMTIDISKKSAVIPVGYGQVRTKDNLTSAVGIGYGSKVSNTAVMNQDNALYGRIPGLTVLENGGEPPTNVNFYIRGQETFNNSSPLILVDGFERPISSLAPGEIQSISVLKDAAALAIYGQRGANGVILATTKRGSAGGLSVNTSYSQGITTASRLPNFLGASNYASAINEARKNDGLTPLYLNKEIKRYALGTSPYLYPEVNWFNQVLRDYGTRSNFNVSFNGGQSNARFFVLMNYANDQGLFGPVNKNDGYSTQLKYGRFNFRSNLDLDLTDHLLFQVNVAGNVISNNSPGGGGVSTQIFRSLYRIPSAAFPVKTPDGSWGGSQVYGNNPVAMTSAIGYGSPNSRELFLDGRLKQDLEDVLDGLSVEAAVSYNNYASFFERKTRQYSYKELKPVVDNAGNLTDSTSTVYGKDTDLNYNSSFGNQRRSMDLLGKINYQKEYNHNVLTAMVLFHQNSMITNGQNNTYHRRNFAGNVNYNISHKYIFDVALSYSGNNLLPKGGRYGFFPAVSGAWIISNEDFLADVGFLDRLKLRASYGITGNDRLPNNNPYKQSYHTTGAGYWFTDKNTKEGGFYEGRLATSNFTYESSYKTNLGVDAQLFEKLTINADVFYDKRTNILTGTNGRISDVIGIQPPRATNGAVENKGFELKVLWQDNAGNFTYHLGGQASVAKNKILRMDERYRPDSYLRRTGQQIGQRFGLEALGFFKNQNDINNSPRQLFSEVHAGDIKYKDQNGDGVVDEYDEVPLGHSTGYPETYFSVDLGFGYKGIDVSALFQGTANYSAYLNTQSVFWPLRNNSTVSSYYYDRRWTPNTGNSASFPRLTSVNNANNFQPNSVWIADRSFVKLRTLEVSYSFPVSITQKLKMKNLKIYVRGMNLFSIDNISVLDPENINTGYPTLRSYNLGLKLSF